MLDRVQHEEHPARGPRIGPILAVSFFVGLLLATPLVGSYWVQGGGSLGGRPCGASGFSASPLGGSRQQSCSKVVADMHLGFRVCMYAELTIGAQNLFNSVPDQNHVGQTRNGRLEDSSGRVIVESPGVFLFSRRSASTTASTTRAFL